MEKYTIKDFKKGEGVYLLDNPEQVMVIMGIESTSKRIVCRWVKGGIVNWNNFLPKDLGKVEDLEK